MNDFELSDIIKKFQHVDPKKDKKEKKAQILNKHRDIINP
jgi:hypothetical protein